MKWRRIHLANPFVEFHRQVEKYPKRFGSEIHQYVSVQRDMLEIYDFKSDEGKKVVDWIERFCILTQGEKAGHKVQLLLWQKWFIYSIFSFWGTFEEPKISIDGSVVEGEVTKKYLRVVNDILLVIGSGNAKTTILGWINTYILFSRDYAASNIYIGSNAQKQSLLCFDTTCDIIRKNKVLNKYARIIRSDNRAEVGKGTDLKSEIHAMSSDGKNFEGIIPTIIVIDETHEMKHSKYADDLRKSIKRDDSFIFESTTQGTVREGYLDTRIEYSNKVLSKEVSNYRFMPVIFAQDSVEEIEAAYFAKDYEVLMKANPSLGFAVSITALMGKIKLMIDDHSQRSAVLTKNFNIAQNPNSIYLSKEECETLPFNEELLIGQPVFIGIDHAFTRSASSDFTNIKIAAVNPLTDERFIKSVYLMPKQFKTRDDELIDAVEAKSKEDSMDYKPYVERGDIILVDSFQITHETIQDYIINFVNEYKVKVKKIGLDPTNITELQSYFNNVTANKKFCIPVFSNKTMWNTPRIENIRRLRADKMVYCNNRLDIVQNANTIAKIDQRNNIFLDTLEKRKHNDAIYAELGLETAIETFFNAESLDFKNALNRDVLKHGYISSKMDYDKFKEEP